MIHCPGCGEENPPRFKLCGYCGTALAAAAAALPVRELRKTVTIVFSDLKGSTAIGERLDAEALHEVKRRYFESMAAEIARHGGKIEKYIGDAIMAVFGLPRTHEDDALRAVRAALGMQDALARVNADLQARYGVTLAHRTGINTGVVVANDDPAADQQLATGDAVNVAARLEQAAPENQIYLGDVTWRLVRDAVEVQPVEPLQLKGKAQQITAWRLVSARGLDGNSRRSDTPIVGREAELAQIARIYHEVVGASAVRLVTVIGDAGVGKSRLVHEVVSHITAGATVLRGRCLPYGDGITFWPLREMLGGAGIVDTDSTEAAHTKLMQFLGDRDVVDRIAAATGLSAVTYPLHEVNWAARRVLEIVAAHAPVVALIDDIHWAEPAFLDLLEHVLATSRDTPILLIATARHDLLESRPLWGEQPGAARIVLRPLTDDAAALVVANVLGSTGLPRDVLERVIRTAEGNPLYVEQLLSMLIDRGVLRQVDGAWVRGPASVDIDVPPTIHALLEARLDQLGRAERATVEPAAVIGLEFPESGLSALAPDAVRPTLDQHLAALTRKQFVHLSMAVDASARYRFHHQLVRDTVYNGMLKRSRAQLHVEFVHWADRVNAARGRALEFQEILGYHLEQAHNYLLELGPLDVKGVAIGVDAAQRLSDAGKRASARGDMHAAANLYRRAIALLASGDAKRVALLPEFGEVLIDLGDFTQARTVLAEAQASAEKIANRRIAASAQLLRMRVGLGSAEPGFSSEDALRMANQAIPLFEAEGAHLELARAWRLIGVVHGMAARYQQSTDAVGRAMTHARSAGEERIIARNAVGLASSTLLGPTPVPEAIGICEQLIAAGLSDRQAESKISCTLAQLHAMNGDFDQARILYRRGRSLLRELGQGVNAASTAIDMLLVELLAGDLAAAERDAMPDYEFLMRAGETYFLSTMAALLSRVVRDQGRDDEALAFSRIAEQTTAADDMESQALWRSLRAPMVARAGNLEEAESLARSAVEMSQQSDAPQMQADSLSELAAVMRLAGRVDEARRSIDAAIAIYATKGDTVSVARATAWAVSLGPPHPRSSAAESRADSKSLRGPALEAGDRGLQ